MRPTFVTPFSSQASRAFRSLSVKSMLQPRVKGQRSCQRAAPTMVVSERKGNGRTVRLARVVMHALFTPSRIEVSGFSLSLSSFCPTSQPAPQCFPLLMSWPPGYFVSRIFHNRVGARGLFPRASSHTTWRTVLVPRGCEQSSELSPSSLFFCLHPLFPLPTSVDNSVPQSSHSEALPCGAFRQLRKRCAQQEETDSLRSFLELRVI